MSDEQATIEMALDAFILNEKVCGDGEQQYRIAPLAQPNYTFLSYDKALVRDDVMDPVELQNAFPPRNNSRYSDLGRNTPRTSRLGVYLHWVLPNVYRTGEATMEDTSGAGNPAPTFKAVPNRWLVIRQIKQGTHEPKEEVVEEFQGWVVESDRQLGVDELHDGVDTQVDVSPYVSTDDTTHQGRYFIGMKKPVAEWAEDDTASRVELTVLSSSNQLFADYQPHNGNVFSILDNFDQKLTAADLNYFVLGWHHDKKNDPLHTQFGPSGASLQERLAKLGLRMRHNFSKALLKELEDIGGTLCCGHIHNVKWNLNERPAIIPAEEAAARFQTPTSPIAIGTGPLDALLAYISSHDDVGTTEQLILKIQTLLLQQSDGVDAQLQAQDMLLNRDYSRVEGGVHWYMSGENPDESAPLQPSETQLETLTKLNAFQQKFDTLRRLLPQARWDLFSEWWRYVCDEGAGRDEEPMKSRVKQLTDRLEELIGTSDKVEESIVDYLPRMVTELSKELPVEPGASARFHMQQDPTILIAGLESGWPRDHTEKSEVTMTSYIRATTRVALPDVLTDMVAKLPTEYHDTAKLLLEGFLGVGSNPEAAIRAYAASGKDAATIEPQFWSMQPWSPLFLEWEGEYFHVPFDKFWSLEERQTGTPNKVLRYGIKSDEDLSLPAHDLINNKRTVSGRVLLLPQPSFSLSAQVTQLFDSLPETELDGYLTKEERERLKEDLQNFPYMSSPMSGFTEHLLTLLEGTHVKPNQRVPGSDTSAPIEQAIDAASRIDIKERQLVLVDQETGPTPYWNHVAGLGDTYPAFKAATHGQFRFTKINIIDKFGQAICAIDPTPRPIPPGPPPIYPCISNFFACQTLAGDPDTPNTVIRDDPGKNQFIQLPPRLNQTARLNAGFMVGSPTNGWRAATEWENPVFGWMVVNHADYGLQVFLPDGRFYREVRLGGQSGSSVSDPWLPFGPPEDGIPETEALDRLIKQLGDSADYLKAFFKMILDAFQSVVEAPDSYAEFLSAIIGKPIALANIGWSLELAAPPLENQSLFNQIEVTETLKSYKLPLKIGDRDRVFDGLVGYYHPLQEERIYTHFPGGEPTTPIDKSNYPTLTPFHINPRGMQPEEFVNAKNQEWHVFTGIVDPFVAVHGYSGILPVDDTVLLPTWTVELALNRMTAFFRLGPLLVSSNVPSFNSDYELKYDYDLENSQTEYPGVGVTLPSLSIAEWNWLQPYYSEDTGNQTKFMGLKLNRMPEKPPPIEELTPPFTAIEGFLQLKRPLGQKFEEEGPNE
ncbi:hypothetical protein JB92DRAFT_3117693 [Gautieria morchelliformis]|nr:hypothetical protein JB92DRAFT_3117693 [Gautieria morchelliformis]